MPSFYQLQDLFRFGASQSVLYVVPSLFDRQRFELNNASQTPLNTPTRSAWLTCLSRAVEEGKLLSSLRRRKTNVPKRRKTPRYLPPPRPLPLPPLRRVQRTTIQTRHRQRYHLSLLPQFRPLLPAHFQPLYQCWPHCLRKTPMQHRTRKRTPLLALYHNNPRTPHTPSPSLFLLL